MVCVGFDLWLLLLPLGTPGPRVSPWMLQPLGDAAVGSAGDRPTPCLEGGQDLDGVETHHSALAHGKVSPCLVGNAVT